MTNADSDQTTAAYGQGDATFKAAGGDQGVLQLVNDFYDILASNTALQPLRKMHPADLSESRDKLYRFLCGWMGGPKRYRERYGPINIIDSHRHLKLDLSLRDQWLMGMQLAVDKQGYPDTLADYLMAQLTPPCDRILATQHQQPQQ